MDARVIARRFLLAVLCLAATALAQPAGPGFATVRGWGVLRWPMSPEEVGRALRAAGHAVHEDTRVGIFPRTPPRRPGDIAPAGIPSFAEVAFVHFQFHANGREVQVDCENGHLQEIRVIRRGLPSQRVAERDLARLRASYGPPVSSAPAQGVARGTEYHWENPDTHLTLLVIELSGSGWFATERWTPAVAWPSWR